MGRYLCLEPINFPRCHALLSFVTSLLASHIWCFSLCLEKAFDSVHYCRIKANRQATSQTAAERAACVLRSGLCGPHQCSADTGADTLKKQALPHARVANTCRTNADTLLDHVHDIVLTCIGCGLMYSLQSTRTSKTCSPTPSPKMSRGSLLQAVPSAGTVDCAVVPLFLMSTFRHFLWKLISSRANQIHQSILWFALLREHCLHFITRKAPSTISSSRQERHAPLG